jgi:hypothetical protein
MWAIKSGSSLYFGFGHDEVGGRFCIASSDLSSVLKLTRVLVPLREGEFVEYTADAYEILATRDGDGRKAGDRIEREPVRSRLRAKDTALIPPFAYFMDQEIAAQETTGRNVITMFRGGSDALRALRPCLDANPTARDAVVAKLDALLGRYDDDEIRREFHALLQRLAERAEFDPAYDHFIDDLVSSRHPLLPGQFEGLRALAALTVESRVGVRPDLLYRVRETERVALQRLSASVRLLERAVTGGGATPTDAQRQEIAHKLEDLVPDLEQERTVFQDMIAVAEQQAGTF